MDKKLTDREAIARSLEDGKAFEVIFERHYDAVARFLARRLPRDLASELTSETFTRAFAARVRIDERYESALPYLLGIAAHLVGRHRRSEERMLRAFARSGCWPDSTPPAEAADTRDLAAALASLKPGERNVLLLVAWADLEYEQVAAALGIPVGTVRSRLSRGRARLRDRLGSDLSAAAKEAVDG